MHSFSRFILRDLASALPPRAMKTLILIVATVACFSLAQAQSEIEWARQSGAEVGEGSAIAVKPDGHGNSYVLARVAGALTGADIQILKYDVAGNVLWRATYDGGAARDDLGNALLVTGDGGVLLAGTAGTASGSDFVVLRYDASGDLRWTYRYDGDAHRDDAAIGLALNDKIEYATGWTELVDGRKRMVTVRLDDRPAPTWVSRYDRIGPGDDVPTGIAASPDPRLVGVVDSGGACNLAILSYDDQGALWDHLVLDQYVYDPLGIQALAPAYVIPLTYEQGGVSHPAALSWIEGAPGTLGIVPILDGVAAGAASVFDNQGHGAGVVLASTENPGGPDSRIVATRFSVGPTMLWNQTYGPTGTEEAVDIGGGGAPVVLGRRQTPATGLDYLFVGFGEDGSLLWTNAYSSGVGPTADRATCMCYDPSQRAVIASGSAPDPSGRMAITTVRLDIGNTAPPTGFTLAGGSLVSGGLAEVGASDDQDMVIADQRTESSPGGFIRIDFEGNIPQAQRIKFEGHVDVPGVTRSVRYYNWVHRRWWDLEVRPASNGVDRGVDAQLPYGAIRTDDHLVKLEVIYRATGPVGRSSWHAYIDRAVWRTP